MMKRPDHCTPIGTYACCVPVTVRDKIAWVDFCVSDIICGLNAAGLETVASCCGHGKMDGIIDLKDGRVLRIVYPRPNPETTNPKGE